METEEEKAAKLAAEKAASDEDTKDIGDVIEPELDEDGKPVEPVVEPWMKEEDDVEDQTLSDDPAKQVPVGKFVSLKKKLRGTISERDDEIERLKKERDEALKLKPKEPAVLKRPDREDFDSAEEYEVAKDKYDDDKLDKRFWRNRIKEQQEQAKSEAYNKTVEAVDQHYDRAAELIETSGIKPEIYQDADKRVRKTVESIVPKMGDVIVDQIISIMGKGSEKVLFYIGRNAAALSKFQTLLSEDKTGMRAAVYLGQEKQRLTKPTSHRSNAPAPAAGVKGDATTNGSANKFKKTYNAAHKSNNLQAAYNAKKEARLAGVDVSGW